ncbi:uncharacterized protein JCM6883_005414 [Sporobolomyces salmoneus]|uniref:uncharacterized protein n=1 Tax=Sporobolomyces salmoneus TaxID=183962 RepID=UPI00317AB59B
MEAVLITRNSTTDREGNLTTSDLRLEVNLPGKIRSQSVETVPASEWSRASIKGSHPGIPQDTVQTDLSYKPHVLPGFSQFGTDEPNEFATFIQGRESYLSSNTLREELEDDLRSFAEKSDLTEGFMLSTPLSDGFSGFTSTFLSHSLRDEFPKSTVWTTGMIQNSLSWKRPDTDRSRNQRLINEALSVESFEEFASMLCPIQPTTPEWDDNAPWAKYLRTDLDKTEVYNAVLNQHLQSSNSELREPDCLTQIVQQLNWRGSNKIASLSGVSPMLPAEFFEGEGGIERLKKSWMDWSVLPDQEGKRSKKEDIPFAQYSVVRGFELQESQALGPLLESSTPLKEPLSQWVSLPHPYPLLPSSLPIYKGLLPSGRPLVLSRPSHSDPSTSSGLFGLPDMRYPSPSSYIVQPSSIPILTTLSTSPSTRHLLASLVGGLKELVRRKDGVLREYEEGEYGIGREGILEVRERLETLMDNYRGGDDGDDGEGTDKDEDENWDDTEDTWDL